MGVDVPVVQFRYFSMNNQGNGVDCYPCMWKADTGKVSWDGRFNKGTYWFLSEGTSLMFLITLII